MSEAIPKIDRRLRDVEAFDPQQIAERGDPSIQALEHKLEGLLDAVFPPGSIEHNRYKYAATTLDTAGYNSFGTPLQEVITGLYNGKAQITSTWSSIKEGFSEELGEQGSLTSGSAILRAYQGLQVHSEIQRAAGDLFRDTHYAQAIVEAVKALNALVRLRSGVDDKDGVALMEAVFNPSTPVLKFNDLADQSDRDEQRGFMMMLSGAVAGLRNPRAHRLMQDDPERALEFIAFISLLAKLVDAARRR